MQKPPTNETGGEKKPTWIESDNPVKKTLGIIIALIIAGYLLWIVWGLIGAFNPHNNPATARCTLEQLNTFDECSN